MNGPGGDASPALGLAFGWGGWVLIGGLAAVAAAGLALLVGMKRTPFPASLAFWWVVSAAYCRVWFRLKRIGPCTVPAEGPVIVAANHTCGIDPLLVIACIPHRLPGYMVAEEYANPPIIGKAMKQAGCIPVRRDGQDTSATRAALRHLKAGNVLGIFIEGRIAEPGETLDAKDGTAMLAVHSGAKVVPVHISGTKWDQKVIWSFLRRHKARVRFGEPIDVCPGGVKPDKEDIPRISAMLLERIRALAPTDPAANPPDRD